MASYFALIHALRVPQDRITGAAPIAELDRRAVDVLTTDLAVSLGMYAPDELDQIPGQVAVPGQAHEFPVVPVVHRC